jgi:hypothetical protein
MVKNTLPWIAGYGCAASWLENGNAAFGLRPGALALPRSTWSAGFALRMRVGVQYACTSARSCPTFWLLSAAAWALAASRPAQTSASSSRMPVRGIGGPPQEGVQFGRPAVISPAGQARIGRDLTQVNMSPPVKRCDVSSSGRDTPMTRAWGAAT